MSLQARYKLIAAAIRNRKAEIKASCLPVLIVPVFPSPPTPGVAEGIIPLIRTGFAGFDLDLTRFPGFADFTGFTVRHSFARESFFSNDGRVL